MTADTAGFAERAGIDNGPVRLDSYRSHDQYARERDLLFRRAWLLLGRVEEVAAPGDYVVKDVEICGASILISHGKDGTIRAFHNVCPHRANQVVWDRKGSASVFMCRYHNWTFNSDGSSRGVPDESMFVGLDRKACSLSSVHLAIWEGWMFVNLADEPEVGLDEYLGGFQHHLSGLTYPYADSPVVIETILECNWKVVSDAFSEAYHIPAIHPASLKPMFSNRHNMFGRLLDARFFGPHKTASMFGNPEYLPSPVQAVEILAYDPRHVAPDHAQALGELAAHPAVNPTKQACWSMDVNALFPNTHIDVNPGGFFVHQFWPMGPRRTRHEARFYVRKPDTVRERFVQEHMIAHAVDIILEDLSNVERTQRGIDSRGTDSMQLSESEILIRHGLDHMDRWTSGLSVRDALAESGGARS